MYFYYSYNNYIKQKIVRDSKQSFKLIISTNDEIQKCDKKNLRKTIKII